MKAVERYAPILGRILISIIFIMSVSGKIRDPHGTMKMMASHGMIVVPFFFAMAVLLELGGCISFITGYKARLGALALIVMLVPTTLIFHNFWAAPAAMKMMQQMNFLKNAAIIGGLFQVLAFGAGPISLDARGKR